MVSCAAALRALCADAKSREEAARRLVRALRDGFAEPDSGERQCALVRLYMTRPLGSLDGDLRAFARARLPANEEPEHMRCLVLLATEGDLPAWSAPERSAGHRAIPLANDETLQRLPMIAQLLEQMGVPTSAIVGSQPTHVVGAAGRVFDVFYVPEARRCPHIPAQDDFVIPHAIHSVLGFGGLLGDGELLTILLFSKAHLPRATATMFRTIALAAKLVFSPLPWATAARGTPASSPDPAAFVAQGQLLETLEAIAYERFQALEQALGELERQTHELRRSEEALRLANAEIERRAAEAIRSSEARLSRLWESNIIGVMYADAHGSITDANDALLHLLGYTHEDLLAQRVRWSELTPREYQPLDERGIAEARGRGACSPYEKVYVAKNGRRVPILIGYALLPGSRDEFICFAIDLTEQKRAEEQERAARAEVERASRLKDEFVATVSHEVRTPLNAIQGWAQLLQRPGTSPEQIAKGLAVIVRNTHQLAQIASDLLDTSRIVSGKLHIQLELVELPHVVQLAVEGVRPTARQKGVTLKTALARMGPILADPVRLRQVVENLLSNATKFTPRGGQVEVLLSSGPGEAILRVRDSGQGIDAGFLPHVFDRFRQADASTVRQQPGLGLGLTIVKHIVEAHGGTVRATSEGPGTGAEFTVTLPVEPRSPDLAPEPGTRPMPPQCLNGMAVLVVDDEPDGRDIAQRFLEEQGATVVTAESAREALDLLAKRAVDVVVSDIGMPGIDGYELARRLDGLPAIALTAFVRPEDRERAIAAGFRAHVVKPVDAAELVAAVACCRRAAT